MPVTHKEGLKYYAGEIPVLPNILRAWNNANGSDLNEAQLWEYLNSKFKDHKDPKIKAIKVIITFGNDMLLVFGMILE